MLFLETEAGQRRWGDKPEMGGIFPEYWEGFSPRCIHLSSPTPEKSVPVQTHGVALTEVATDA